MAEKVKRQCKQKLIKSSGSSTKFDIGKCSYWSDDKKSSNNSKGGDGIGSKGIDKPNDDKRKSVAKLIDTGSSERGIGILSVLNA